MVHNLNDFDFLVKKSLSSFNDFCSEKQLLNKIEADHVGFKCESKESYENKRGCFEFESLYIFQSIISNRRISVIGLRHGIETTVGYLNYLELSDQKQDNSQKEGVDHVEVVPRGCTYEELITHLLKQGVTLKENIKPHHTTYDTILPSGFVIKFSREKLVDKIKRDEIK
ncbi:MAG: hypothetical protein RI935_626 [Candidatus Parcubacteria bacterium]|jgi:predicted metalloenzyme YecM